MSIYYGKTGTINVESTVVARITDWILEILPHIDAFGSSDTPGYKDSVVGVTHASGQCEFKLDENTASPPHEGSIVTLWLEDNTSEYWVGSAAISNFMVKVDRDDHNAVTVKCSFKSKGQWTKPKLTATTLTTTAPPPPQSAVFLR